MRTKLCGAEIQMPSPVWRSILLVRGCGVHTVALVHFLGDEHALAINGDAGTDNHQRVALGNGDLLLGQEGRRTEVHFERVGAGLQRDVGATQPRRPRPPPASVICSTDSTVPVTVASVARSYHGEPSPRA
jgi:hypothetical protein